MSYGFESVIENLDSDMNNYNILMNALLKANSVVQETSKCKMQATYLVNDVLKLSDEMIIEASSLDEFKNNLTINMADKGSYTGIVIIKSNDEIIRAFTISRGTIITDTTKSDIPAYDEDCHNTIYSSLNKKILSVPIEKSRLASYMGNFFYMKGNRIAIIKGNDIVINEL